MSALKNIMIRAWEIARSAIAAFGGSVREYFAASLKQSWKENTTVEREEVNVGREGVIFEDLTYTNAVRGGGAITPAVREFVGYDRKAYVSKLRSSLSGSGRSGTITWQLEEDKIYELLGVAVTSSKSDTRYVSTFDGVTTKISSDDLNAVMKRRYPEGAELAKVRAQTQRLESERRAVEEAKREREYQERLENRRLELEAEAERIEAEGQGNEDLPDLTGSPKQIAWALKIRGEVAARAERSHQKLAALKTATTAKYWIDNHRNALAR